MGENHAVTCKWYAQECTVYIYALPVRTECQNRRRGEGHHTAAFGCLWFLEYDPSAREAMHYLDDRKRCHVQVYVFPTKPKKLGPPESGINCQVYEREIHPVLCCLK